MLFSLCVHLICISIYTYYCIQDFYTWKICKIFLKFFFSKMSFLGFLLTLLLISIFIKYICKETTSLGLMSCFKNICKTKKINFITKLSVRNWHLLKLNNIWLIWKKRSKKCTEKCPGKSKCTRSFLFVFFICICSCFCLYSWHLTILLLCRLRTYCFIL